jgi:putative ABC transport system permease protein
MQFYTLIWKNLIRRPVRSGLTVFAVAISIGCVVALVGISTGFKRTFTGLYETKNLDMIVVRSGQGQRLASTLDQGLADKFRQIPGIKFVFPGLVDVISFEEQGIYGAVAQGLNMDQRTAASFRIVEGRTLTENDRQTMLLGSILARNLGKTLHDKVEIFEGQFFEVVGIFDNSNVFENGSMILPLAEMQRLLDRSNQVTGFSVVLEPEFRAPEKMEQVRREVEGIVPGLSAMPIREHVDTVTEIRAASAMAWLTSVLALVVGTAGVLNTMLMSVMERTREIGVFRAIGWTSTQVVKMVLTESILLSLIGAVIGTLAALVIVRVLTVLPTAGGFVDGYVPPYVIAQGFLIAVLIGLMGGSLAALNAARMLPTEALRHD